MRKALKIFFIIIIAAVLLVPGVSAYVAQSVSDDIAGVDAGSGISEAEAEE